LGWWSVTVVAAAMIDRLVHHTEILSLKVSHVCAEF
jgi:hypothetical protein